MLLAADDAGVDSCSNSRTKAKHSQLALDDGNPLTVQHESITDVWKESRSGLSAKDGWLWRGERGLWVFCTVIPCARQRVLAEIELLWYLWAVSTSESILMLNRLNEREIFWHWQTLTAWEICFASHTSRKGNRAAIRTEGGNCWTANKLLYLQACWQQCLLTKPQYWL